MSAETFSLHFAHLKQSTCHNAELREQSDNVYRRRTCRGRAVPSADADDSPERDDDSAVLLIDDLLASSAAGFHFAQRRDR